MSDDYELERTATREDAAAVLRGIADGAAAGSVRLGDAEDAIAVEIPDAVDLEVEFETTEGDGRSVEVELEWSEPTAVEEFDADGAESAPGEGDDSSDDGADDDAAEPPVGAAQPLDGLARFEVFADRAGEWRWRLVHRNGNVIATSGEGYTRKHSAEKGLRSVMENVPGAETVED